MPATQIQLSASLQAAFSKANNVFSPTVAGPTTLSFSLQNISLTTWSQVFLGTWTLFAGAPAGVAAVLASGGTLSAGTPLFYKITALGYNGLVLSQETQGSAEVTATPTGGTLSIKLTWTALPGAVSYNVYRGTVTNTENLLITNVTTNTFTDTGALAGSSASPPSTPPVFIEFDLSTFTSLAAEAATSGHILGIVIGNSGVVGSSQCTLATGSSNGLVWFLGGAITMRINGFFVFTGPPTGDVGQVIDSTHKTLRITNGGTAATTVSVAAIVGP
jgi:hypothetical protein